MPASLENLAAATWLEAGLEEAQAGIRIARRNINNLRYADDTTLMAESEEELKSLFFFFFSSFYFYLFFFNFILFLNFT